MLEKIKNRAIRLAMQAYMATRRHSVTDGVVGIQLRRPKKAPHYSSEVLRAGSVQSKGASPLPVDIQVERDVPVRLRDGTTIYTDVFRPTGADRVPAVVAWSPYGKTEPFDSVAKPEQALSGLQKFEAADPGWWVPHGYAVIQPDIRGIGNSGGRFTQWGTQDGRDGYDLVEWIAEQSWSNGKVGFAGNSWLSISQWFIGAQRPPHLAALAPWEGFADVYRNTVAPGGVPSPEFAGMVPVVLRGRQYGEDLPAMVDRHPLMDDYWRDKIAAVERITVPTYVVSSYTNKVHTRGTIHAFNALTVQDKWLRIHNIHEWRDFYRNQEDLLRFFDRYLKGVDNGWESTPRVRMSVLDPGGEDETNIVTDSFPPPGTEPVRLYLTANAGLSRDAQAAEASVAYTADDGRSRAQFTMVFTEDTTIAGHWKLRLWVEADGADDIDLFLQCQKLDAAGNVIPVIVKGAPYGDANGVGEFEWGHGVLRASRRAVDDDRSSLFVPFHPLDREQRLRRGETVPVEIEIPPMAMRWHAGEQLRLLVAGYNMQSPEFNFLAPTKTLNKGRTVLHVGGRYDSHLLAPVLKP